MSAMTGGCGRHELPGVNESCPDCLFAALSASEARAKELERVEACGGCGAQIANGARVYRCTDCDVPFHKDCLKKHCEDDLARERATVEAMRSADCPNCGESRAAVERKQAAVDDAVRRMGDAIDSAQAAYKAAHAAEARREEAERRAERVEAVLVARHGGEPLALIGELDEARTERDEARRALRDLVTAYDFSYLDRGIGTATSEGRRWLRARALSGSGAKEGR
jgi:hypothetical protein